MDDTKNHSRNSIAIYVVVPEPSVAAFIFLGSGGILAGRKRRNSRKVA